MKQNPLSARELAKEVAVALHFLKDALQFIQDTEEPTNCNNALSSLMYARASLEVVRIFNTLGGGTNLNLFKVNQSIDYAYFGIKDYVKREDPKVLELEERYIHIVERVSNSIHQVEKIKAQLIEQAAYERLQTKGKGGHA